MRWRRRTRTGVALCAAAAALAGLSGCSSRPAAAPSAAPPPAPLAARPSAEGPTLAAGSAVTAGPSGPVASWVVTENDRPGTTAWQISGVQPSDVSAATTGIAGYADRVDATVGQSVRLYVSTPAPSYTVTAYRMGWYHGAGARQVWTSSALPGAVQPRCPVAAGTNMVACDWSPSLTVPVTDAWVQGEYLLKLVGSGGQQSYVPLTVWDPTSTAAYVIMDGSLTDQVFNAYGGADLYQGATPCAPDVYPCSSRARVVSFDRPYAGRGDGGYLGLTYPLTRLAESRGLDVTYWTDLTLAEHGDLLRRHRALLSPGHDEEWSASMRSAAVAAVGAGVNLAFFGASPVLRKVRLDPSALGPDREVVNYRDPEADPDFETDPADVSQNDWTQAPASLPPSLLVGATYIGFNNGESFPLVDTDPGSWLYAGTGLLRGGTVPGVLRADFQADLPGEPGPRDVEVQADSPVDVTGKGPAHADTTYYTAPSGAGVWQSGSNGWIPAIGSCDPGSACPTQVVQRMTLNVLAVLGDGPAGRTHPSRPASS